MSDFQVGFMVGLIVGGMSMIIGYCWLFRLRPDQQAPTKGRGRSE